MAGSVCRRPTDVVGGDTADRAAGGPRAHPTTGPVAEGPSVQGTCPTSVEVDLTANGERPILDRLPFNEIWAVDFEFGADPGENPQPVCLVAWELRTGRKLRLWRDEFGTAPPYPTGADVLFVAY